MYGYTQKENCTADKREKASLEFNEFDVLGQEKEGVVIFPFFSSVKNLGKWQHTINGNGSFLYIVAAFICIPFTFLLMKKGLLLLFDYYFFTVYPNIWIIRETPDSAFVGSKSGRIEKSIWSALQEKKSKIDRPCRTIAECWWFLFWIIQSIGAKEVTVYLYFDPLALIWVSVSTWMFNTEGILSNVTSFIT